MLARTRLLAVVVTLAVLAAACGSTLSDQDVLRANGVTRSNAAAGGSGTTTDGGAAATTTSGGNEVDGGSPAAPGATTGPLTGADATTGGPTTVGAAAAIGTPGQTGPIVIGSVGNYSGPAGSAQAGIPQAVQVWAASVNAKGGLFGRPVKVIVQDDGGDPARYAAAVRDLVENRGVIAFVGQGAVLSVRGGLPYLAQKGIPVIGDDCAATDWYQPSTNNFPQCADGPGQSSSYISLGVRLTGKTRIGEVWCGESPACTTQAPYYDDTTAIGQRTMHGTGARTVYKAQVSIAQIDFTANCQAAQAAKVDLMFVLADPGTLVRFVRSCDRQGFKPQYVVLSISGLADTVTLPGLSRVVLGVPTFPFAGASTPAIDEFRRAMAAYSNVTPGPAQSEGWVAAKLFELAATRAAQASGKLTPATLLAALRTVKGETLGGLTVALDFTSTTPHNQPCGFAMQGDGKGGWTTPLGPGVNCSPGFTGG
jgi:branched-chain amino acid transport system substrate-binding protein